MRDSNLLAVLVVQSSASNVLSNNPQTLAWEPLGSLHIKACPRKPLAEVEHLFPPKYIEAIRDNAPNKCCHDVDNLDVDAWFSCLVQEAKSVPNIYKFYCNGCGRCHARFIVEPDYKVDWSCRMNRPFWDAC